MVRRFNFFFRWFARRFFPHFDLGDGDVARLRALEAQGSVVYVMRYASRLDYFLFNAIFAREGLRLSAFANGLSFYYYQPLWRGVRNWLRRRRLWGAARREADLHHEREKVREVARSGQSMFLFLRTARLGSLLRGREAAIEHSRRELDLLAEIVRETWSGERRVFLVPLALFWRKGPRAERRFLNLTYGAATRPSDLAKVTSFLVTYRDLAIKLGDAIDLASFIEKRRDEGEPVLVRKVRRSILLFLFREERLVEGPVLRPLHRVQEQVLSDRRVQGAVAARCSGGRVSEEAARAEAEKLFREIAANMSSTLLSLLAVVVGVLFRRLFAGLDVRGLERATDCAKRHPVVLVPSHRSYFDFLILSWFFYQNHVVPPHVAARENMAFGPFGYLFRSAGAYFMRQSFDDELYKAVFRSYIGYLVKEGFTQEFFIEGGRSRTGKSLAPRLGMLSWNLQAFVDSGRRELFIVPVAITYERLVEEGAMVDELEGGKKRRESLLGLMRARKVLSRRFGSVFVNFAEPLSLGTLLEGRRQLFAESDDPALLAERRSFSESLANDIVERINWAMVASATSVAACALLGEPHRGMFRGELGGRMRDVIALLRLQGVELTPALSADEPEYRESIDSMVRAGLLRAEDDARGAIVYWEESRLRALDVYRNGLLHYLAAPSFLARRLLHGATREALAEDLAFWLDFFYDELFAPTTRGAATQLGTVLAYFERIGVLEARGDELRPSPSGHDYFTFLAEQTQSLLEAYAAALRALAGLSQPASQRTLERAAQAQFRRAHLLGEVRRTEGWNAAVFGNALELLARRAVLERVAASGRDRMWKPGPEFAQLAAVRERLATALSGG